MIISSFSEGYKKNGLKLAKIPTARRQQLTERALNENRMDNMTGSKKRSAVISIQTIPVEKKRVAICMDLTEDSERPNLKSRVAICMDLTEDSERPNLKVDLTEESEAESETDIYQRKKYGGHHDKYGWSK